MRCLAIVLAATLVAGAPAVGTQSPAQAQMNTPDFRPPPVIRRPARLPEPLANRPERALPDDPRQDDPGQDAQPQAPAAGAGPGIEPDMVVVSIATATQPGLAAEVAGDYGLALVGEARLALVDRRVLRLRIPDGRPVGVVLAALAGDPRVTAAQPSVLYGLEAGSPPQYTAGKLRLAEAHAAARGEGITIALIDTRIDPAHPALAGAQIRRLDVWDGPPGAGEHGTKMAGIMVARQGLIGVAPGARLIAIAAFGVAEGAAAPRSHSLAVATALDRAAAEGAQIINLSFAGGEDPLVADVLDALARRGAVLVAAAGNAGPEAPPAYPAAHPQVIGVTATAADDRLYARANRGGHVALAAPGVDVIAPAPGGRYAIVSGTSAAAAHVSGLAALVLERQPGLRPAELHALLARAARDLGAPGPDPEFGAGLIDPVKTLSQLPERLARPAN